MIVLATIAFLAYQMLRMDIWRIALLLVGATFGFWIYNYHPASIFMGDCGALYLGFNLACLSLLGFKTATFISLGFPIIMLFVPISDTLIAIVRRKLKGIRFDAGDREHMHHILMYKLKLGHKNAVLTLYVITALFSAAAIISYYHENIGIICVLLLVFLLDLFVEYTGMINKKYHPVLGLIRRIFGWPEKRIDE